MATRSVYVQSRDNETNIAAQITRIQGDRDKIRAKLVTLSLATSSDNLDTLATTIESIPDNGAVDATVKEGESYTIPKGYHNGSGVVKGVAGGGNYTLQTKTATPTKMQQNITSDEGYYGLSSVTVEPIPETYQDVTSVTATAPDVLSGKTIVTSDGSVTPGTMPNNGAASKVLDTTTKSYTIPLGYHNGKGSVSIVTETKSATPTEEEQTISPTTGKVLSSVTVGAIPSNYIKTEDATATADGIKQGLTAYVDGEKITGTMPVIETADNKIGISSSPYTIPKGFHDGTGTVSIDSETKSVTPTKSEQTVSPTTGKALASVTVKAIPAEYITTTDANAVATDILTGKTAYVNGKKVTGTMPEIEAVDETIDTTTTEYTIPAGYHDGTGTVSVVVETKTATPTKAQQQIAPTTGKVLSQVTVNAIPDEYITTTDATATASQILNGSTAYVAGAKVTGTMPNNGATNLTIDGMLTMTASVPAGYTSGGTVTLTDSIETALAAI